MKKFFEYNEPEFKVVVTSAQDVLTTSTGGTLGQATGDWDPAVSGTGDGGMTFGL